MIWNMPKEVLEEDHYGLEQVKERVLEFLAVRSADQEREKLRSFVWWDLREPERLPLQNLWQEH